MSDKPSINNTVGSSVPSDLVGKTRTFLGKVSDTNSGSASQSNSVKGISNILDAFLAKGILKNDEYNSLKFESINTGKPADFILVEKQKATWTDIAKTYSEMRGIPFVDIKNTYIENDVLQKLPKDVAEANRSIVFEDLPDKVKIAMKDPLDLQRLKYLESFVGKRVEAYYAADDDLLDVIQTRYGAQIGREVDEALADFDDSTLIDLKESEQAIANQTTEEAPIIKIVNMILDYGIKNKASDIHIEPREGKVSVRFRVRGVLSEKLTIPRKLHSAIITRIKILSNRKIDEHRIPQDGRFQIKNESSRIDVRVSIMPSIYGEKIVMRLLEKTQGIMDIEKTGIRGAAFAKLKESLAKTQGIILVTGPTGSGKTQTLASCLKNLNSPDVNIITLEDPVEIRIDGVTQVQVNPEVGLTFASGLRSILRQDPDIIMVGEIRDSETAALAVQSALIGRLVLSTVHTNNAAGAFIRLIDMGIEPFLLSSTVNVSVGQRLVRVLCDCKQAYEAPIELVDDIHKELDPLNGFNLYNSDHTLKLKFDKNTQNITLYKPVGCPKCGNTGYITRTGIFEVLKMSEKISALVMDKKSISEIHNQAIKEGMITMVQDGFIKALEGITTIEEVFRVRNE